jgi:aspartyl-tRNA(Asn)/glutamyl-tRNA(Gln) amidotransferase subunit C
MADALSRDDVRRVAALAHLELTDSEVALFSRQLGDVLHYAQQVQAVDTTGVPPTAHLLAGEPLERDDTPRPCLDRDLALDAAPDPATDAGLFRVPRVIGG